MPDKKLTDELLNELLDAPNIDGYIKEHDFAAPSLSDYLKQLLQEKGLERSRVVRMADLNETFGYQIFTGARHPSRNKVLQIAFAMALTLKETNRALTAAGVSVLNCKDRRDAIVIFCIDRGCSLQKVNEELYRFGEETVSLRPMAELANAETTMRTNRAWMPWGVRALRYDGPHGYSEPNILR